jgi:uncharacterized protein GlcG (DUF336 family)
MIKFVSSVWSLGGMALQGACLGLLLSACGGGGEGPGGVSPTASVYVASTPQKLSSSDVQKIVAQAVQAAVSKNVDKGVIAVVDRVGNVLAVWQIGTPFTVSISSGRTLSSSPQGLDGLSQVPAELAAISKAITGAYLSSSGNAFSTRTASYIIQEHFAPTILSTAAGPLFGVQFSQLPCGDLVTNAIDGTTTSTAQSYGPHRAPLGLSGDPGGFPLYIDGVVVGGVGVMTNHSYTLDIDPISSVTTTTDEIIAQSATSGYTPYSSIRADTISLGGTYPTYSNADSVLVSVNAITPSVGSLLTVSGYYSGSSYLDGLAYGSDYSGYVASTETGLTNVGTFPAGTFMLTTGHLSNNRYSPTAVSVGKVTPSSTTNGLTSTEVTQILKSALAVANKARAQIRHPLGSSAQVTISVVDALGNILGVIRTADAPVFGTDVSLQKARTATFFSASVSNNSYSASSALSGMNTVTYFPTTSSTTGSTTITLSNYASASSSYSSSSLDGTYAFSTRSLADISRPWYPDGIQTSSNPGPLSKSYTNWSVFSTGVQLDSIYTGIVTAIVHATYTPGGVNLPNYCMSPTNSSSPAAGTTVMKNGPQIFAGGTPIYRNGVMIGAIGTSGDGTIQDDMISYLGVKNAAAALNEGTSTFGLASSSIWASNLNPGNLNPAVHPTFVSCPYAPYIDGSTETYPCP